MLPLPHRHLQQNWRSTSTAKSSSSEVLNTIQEVAVAQQTPSMETPRKARPNNTDPQTKATCAARPSTTFHRESLHTLSAPKRTGKMRSAKRGAKKASTRKWAGGKQPLLAGRTGVGPNQGIRGGGPRSYALAAGPSLAAPDRVAPPTVIRFASPVPGAPTVCSSLGRPTLTTAHLNLKPSTHSNASPHGPARRARSMPRRRHGR